MNTLRIFTLITFLSLFLLTAPHPLVNANEIGLIKQAEDYILHFLFFNQTILDHFKQSIVESPSLKLYYYNCSEDPIPQCSLGLPIILLFNRIVIKYNGQSTESDYVQWAKSRIYTNPTEVYSQEHLQSLIKQENNWLCLCENQATSEVATFTSFAKQYPFINCCIIKNMSLSMELGLKRKNVTYFKTSLTERIELIYENRYDIWQMFGKSNMISTVFRISDLTGQRFTHNQKNIDDWAVACDFSFKCQSIWRQLNRLKSQGISQITELKLLIADTQSDIMFNLFYHIIINHQKLPALIHINLNNLVDGKADGCGRPVRHIKYITGFIVEKFTQFKEQVGKGLKPQYLSAPNPRLNGFIGKGSQKLVQKLTARNYEDIIKNRNKTYIVLITALNLGCSECENFYNEYKKMASLFSQQNITFAMLDSTKNQIPVSQISIIPEIIMYRLDNTQPIIMERRHNFDYLLQFLNKNISPENKQLSTEEQKNKEQEIAAEFQRLMKDRMKGRRGQYEL